MNTYPAEYLLHPVPVLAVYGLSADQTSTENEKTSVKESEDSIAILSSSPQTRPSSGRQGLGSNPSHLRSGLASTLHSILHNKHDFTLYEATRYLHQNSVNGQGVPPFRVLSVTKDYTLPPPSSSPHSPLSPLTPQSPLYPDGILSPLWINKYLETPSVIVGFYELWDWSSETGQGTKPVRETGPLGAHVMMDPTERENDVALAQEINDKRKYFQDKGVKFSAVILLKSRHTEDPGVEERLNLIKKQSGLDTKNSFFTVAPGSHHDLQDFVNTVYEPALQYYNNLIKKWRKKKSKLPWPASSTRPSMADLTSNEPQPLSPQGWQLRYDLKIAFIQELKQDIEAALKTCVVAYGLLGDVLAPTSSVTQGLVSLPARGKRWTEARALADCLNIKICRFYLFLNDHTAAFSQLNGHLHLFQTYSSAWGMGEQSFEYWEWLSKQYRIFADVIDSAIQAGFKIPLPTAYLNGTTNVPGSPLLGGSNSNLSGTQVIGCNPGAIIQHPGFYYHLAAMCCAERRRRFLDIERSEAAKTLTTNKESVAPNQLETLLSKERQVDHSSLTIELLTKSYEQFKKYRNGRMTLYLAAEIAGTYYETGKFEMALKFFERIGKTYRKENWHMVLTSILRWSLRCAKELGSWERAVECLVELIAEELPMAKQKRADIQKELFDILYHNEASNVTKHGPLTIAMDQINPFLKCSVQFLNQTSFVDTPELFQVSLSTDKNSPVMPFRFNAMRILFSDPQYNCYLEDAGIDGDMSKLELIDFSKDATRATTGDYVDWVTKKVDLRVTEHQTRAFQGQIVSKECDVVKIVGVCLDLISPQWNVALSYTFDKSSDDQVTRRKWLEPLDSNGRPKFRFIGGRGELSAIKITQRPPRIQLSVRESSPALLDEDFEMCVTVTSEETERIDVTLTVEVKNPEGQDTGDRSLDSASLQIGMIEPGKSVSTIVYIHGTGNVGSRLVNLKAEYVLSSASGKTHVPKVEKSESITIPFISPFETTFELCAQGEEAATTVPFDLKRSEKWLMVAGIECCSTWDLDIESVGFEQEVFEHPYTSLKLLSKMDSFMNRVWKSSHVYNANYLFRLSTMDMTEAMPSVPTGNIVIRWKRQGQEGAYSKTVLKCPALEFQPLGLVVIADVPSELYMGEPFTLTYTIHNPTINLAEYTASIELSDAFVFSGYKQLKGRVLPLSRASYQYTCYPLQAGKVRLPRLKVIAKHQGSEKEVPIELLAVGVVTLDNGLQQTRQSPEQQPTLVFVGAKRHY
ncbi:Gryzun, putative trafficking through golgi-domain-containing protein [Phycomyces nitens]|nr:Gryzun, putative trafficking through golgi-domain-containing protein [Phycomyces nitens]